jgi:hypothetical protein
MSDTDTSDRAGREKSTINIRLTESFLDDIDAMWHEEGTTTGASSSATLFGMRSSIRT